MLKLKMALFTLKINKHPTENIYIKLLDTNDLVAMEALATVEHLTFFSP